MNRRSNTNIVNWRRARRLRPEFQSRPSLGTHPAFALSVHEVTFAEWDACDGNHVDASADFDWSNESCSDGIGETRVPVGLYKANGLGLYDMHGNVWEWVQACWDALVRGYAVGRKPLAALGVRRACFARRLPGRQSEVPPRRAPGPGFRRQPQRRPRVPCGPDACPPLAVPSAYCRVSTGAGRLPGTWTRPTAKT